MGTFTKLHIDPASRNIAVTSGPGDHVRKAELHPPVDPGPTAMVTGSGSHDSEGALEGPVLADYSQVALVVREAAGVDAVAIATWCGALAPRIEATDPPDCELDLRHSVFRQVAPTQNAAERGTIDLLLAGELQWCWTVAPPGFAHCALLSLPGGRFCIVANRHRHRVLRESDLRSVIALVTEFLAVPWVERPATSRYRRRIRCATDHPYPYPLGHRGNRLHRGKSDGVLGATAREGPHMDVR